MTSKLQIRSCRYRTGAAAKCILPCQRIQGLLDARALIAGLKRGRLRERYPTLSDREINLRLIEELSHKGFTDCFNLKDCTDLNKPTPKFHLHGLKGILKDEPDRKGVRG
jgi:hypothetical protein